MERTKTQIEESLKTFNRKTKELNTATCIIRALGRWLETRNEAYLRDIILYAAWLYTRDYLKTQDTVKALDKIKEMSR
jgi:hypothetical protein